LDHFGAILDHFHGGFHMPTSQQNGQNGRCRITFPLSCAILAGGCVSHTFFGPNPVTRVTGSPKSRVNFKHLPIDPGGLTLLG
jgi:hypothetical protein